MKKHSIVGHEFKGDIVVVDCREENMEFVPQRIDSDHITFVVDLKTCYQCKKDMVSKNKPNHFGHNVFPLYYENTFLAQAERAGLVLQSDIKVDDEYICEECKSSGNADFLCSLCGDRKRFPEKEIFGDPPEFLCYDCYNTVSAKDWEDMIDKLEEKHRYDFE